MHVLLHERGVAVHAAPPATRPELGPPDLLDESPESEIVLLPRSALCRRSLGGVAVLATKDSRDVIALGLFGRDLRVEGRCALDANSGAITPREPLAVTPSTFLVAVGSHS